MGQSASERNFIPATSPPEAISRIFSLSGRAPGNTRGEKRALLALRDALGLSVDTVRTNAVLGRALAEALDVEWLPERHTDTHRVTLAGLNTLLAGASRAQSAGSLRRLKEAAPAGLSGPEWHSFRPARSKIEAVTRIADLTGAPREWLGPGSKEHKSVLVNLADALFPQADEINMSSKTKLGASLASVLGVPWDDHCESTGYTISLAGLNTVLAGAERYLGRLGSDILQALATPEDEGDALAAALLGGLPTEWNGRRAVTWLADQGLRGANDNEWQGFYGEEMAKIVLGGSFAPNPKPPTSRYGNTPFDYSLNWVWDIKVHTEIQVRSTGPKRGGNGTQLNDAVAIRQCVDEQGLGFLIVSGAANMDETGEFVSWHRTFKTSRRGKKSAPSNSGNSRTRKASFTPMFVEAFWIPNAEALDAAILAGRLAIKTQGRQAPKLAGESGAQRADKFEMRMSQSRAALRIARHDWPAT